jgi:hypothetical protein
MANASITDWATVVSYYAKDATNEASVLAEAIVATIRDFCRFTHLWKQNLDAISVEADEARYSLTLPTTYGDKAEIAVVNSVKFKEDGADDNQYYPLKPTSRTYLDSYDTSWEFRESPRARQWFYDHITEELVLVDIPTEESDDGLLVRVGLMPDITATTVPSFLLEKYKYDIAHGAAGYLMRMSNKRWYNRELGDYQWELYINARMNAQQDHDLGFTDREDYVMMPEPGMTGGSRARDWVF